jgi:hypothetical protein
MPLIYFNEDRRLPTQLCHYTNRSVEVLSNAVGPQRKQRTKRDEKELRTGRGALEVWKPMKPITGLFLIRNLKR